MKILYVYPELDYKNDNPFVYTLVNSLRNENCIVDCSIEYLWSDFYKYDIIHFQWPESIFNWRKISQIDITKLSIHLSSLKERGVKIVYTYHNSSPHYTNNKELNELYKLIENFSDVILHMGSFSLKSLLDINLNDLAKHFIVPHQTFDKIYQTNIDKQTARKKLHIENNKFVFLCFGAFRDDEERKMVLNSFSTLIYPSKLLIAPRFYKYSIDLKHPRALFKGLIERARFFNKLEHTILSSKFIDNKILSYYFSAADVVFIQRTKILNSGNIPMAFHFGKTVIGPKEGNVGELLEQTGNITFNPKDSLSIVNAMTMAVDKVKSGQGITNKEYAEKYLKTEIIAKQLKDIYIAILNNK